jgi:hypothetical protein
VVRNIHEFDTPPPEEIPIRVLQLYETLQQMPSHVTIEYLDALVGAFEALALSYKDWMRPHLGNFEPEEIVEYGPKLDKLDYLTTRIADAALKEGNGIKFTHDAYELIRLMQDLWTKMDKKGLSI